MRVRVPLATPSPHPDKHRVLAAFGHGRGISAKLVPEAAMRRDVLCYVTVKNAAGEMREALHFELDAVIPSNPAPTNGYMRAIRG